MLQVHPETVEGLAERICCFHSWVHTFFPCTFTNSAHTCTYLSICHLHLKYIYINRWLTWAHMPWDVIIIPSLPHTGDTFTHTMECAFLYIHIGLFSSYRTPFMYVSSLLISKTLHVWMTKVQVMEQIVRMKDQFDPATGFPCDIEKVTLYFWASVSLSVNWR